MKREIELLIPALVILIAPIMILVGIITRGTCFFKHQKKKYVACQEVGRYVGTQWIRSCSCPYSEHKYRARWVCESCSKMGEHCVKGWGEWTVEHGNLVPNVKKLSNWGAGT